jgi:predicted nuclease of predicted toxin-antitoxin system
VTDALRWRAWIDAQLPPALVRALSQTAGLEARHVADENLLDATDTKIFAAARDGGVQVVITKDEDFLQLLDRHGPPPQIVWITCGNIRNAELLEIVLAAWPRVDALLRSGEPLVEIGRRA